MHQNEKENRIVCLYYQEFQSYLYFSLPCSCIIELFGFETVLNLPTSLWQDSILSFNLNGLNMVLAPIILVLNYSYQCCIKANAHMSFVLKIFFAKSVFKTCWPTKFEIRAMNLTLEKVRVQIDFLSINFQKHSSKLLPTLIFTISI